MAETKALDTDAICEQGQKVVDALPAEVVALRRGQPIAVDVTTGAYEIADTIEAAEDALNARGIDDNLYFSRVGERALWRIGGFRKAKSP